MWRGMTAQNHQGLVSRLLGFLIQPQLQSFVCKGLRMEQHEFVVGAGYAVERVLDEARGLQQNRNGAVEDDNPLENLMEEKLATVVTTAAQFNTVPSILDVHNATLSHMNVIIGATRQSGPGNAHATVGDHLVIVVNDEDLNPELPPWLTGMLVRSVDFQRQVILNRGFTVQFACDFDMSLSFPESSASGVTASTATATAADGAEHILACVGGVPEFEERQNHRLVFEAELDAYFRTPPVWRLVDINGCMAGNKFWEGSLAV